VLIVTESRRTAVRLTCLAIVKTEFLRIQLRRTGDRLRLFAIEVKTGKLTVSMAKILGSVPR